MDTLGIRQNPDTVTVYSIPVFSTGGSDAESDLDEQDVSSLLQSSKDLFTQFASFQFGVARYRMRGYSGENQMVMLNGVNVTNPETGFSSWSSWGGLNDVTRFTETRSATLLTVMDFRVLEVIQILILKHRLLKKERECRMLMPIAFLETGSCSHIQADS